MITVPAFYLRDGKLVRPTPWSSADPVFGGTLLEAARHFREHTPARFFYVVDLDRAANHEDSVSIRVAGELAKAFPDVRVMLEGGIKKVHHCLSVMLETVLPVADQDILSDPLLKTATKDFFDGQPLPIAACLHGDDDAVLEPFADMVELSLWGIVHHSTQPWVSLDLASRYDGRPYFFAREPAAHPDNVEEVVKHDRRLGVGGMKRVVVDAEWYLDINTWKQPFDLLRPDAPRLLHERITPSGDDDRDT